MGRNNDHDAKGRFTRGNRAARRANSLAVAPQYRDLFRETVTPERFKEILDKLVSAALEGDANAGAILLRQTIGSEPVLHDIDLGDIESMDDLTRAAATLAAAVAGGQLSGDRAREAVNALQLAKSIISEQQTLDRLEALERHLADGASVSEGARLSKALDSEATP